MIIDQHACMTILISYPWGDAQKTLDTAQKAWETKRDQVTTNANAAIANYNAQIVALTKQVQITQTQYNTVRNAP